MQNTLKFVILCSKYNFLNISLYVIFLLPQLGFNFIKLSIKNDTCCPFPENYDVPAAHRG